MSDSPLSNPMLIGPLALAVGGSVGIGGTAAVSSVGEELTHCEPLIKHALNHQRKELQIEQITIRVNALESE
jgi:hypothetical protein